MQFDHYSIRLLQRDDLQDYFNLIESNRKRLEDFFAGTVAITQTIEDTKKHLNDVVTKAADKKYFPFIVIDDSNRKMVASIQVKSIDWSIPKGELGYYVDAAYEGKGIVSNAVAQIIDFCFNELQFNKLFIRTHESNLSSRRIAEKNGFELEGILRRDYRLTNGQVVDSMYYGLLRQT